MSECAQVVFAVLASLAMFGLGVLFAEVKNNKQGDE